ncbi:TaqI-like C-terminal specificity domain-containing protein [Helicobacter mustelae]
MVYALYGLSSEEIAIIGGGQYIVFALLLVGAIHSKLLDLLKLLCEHFASELKEAFYFCEGLSVPNYQYEGKIIYPNMAKEFIAHLDTQGFFTNQKCFILTDNVRDKDRLLYLTAILNSKTNFWYFKQIGATLGASGYEMSKIFVEKLPIPKNPDAKILTQIEDLASRIIELRKSLEEMLNTQKSKAENKIETKEEIQSKELEQNLDSLIYKLYGLDEEEIKIIESEFSSKRERERSEIIDKVYQLVLLFIQSRFASTDFKILNPAESSKTAQNLESNKVAQIQQNFSRLLQDPISDRVYQGKIVWNRISQELCFSYDNKGYMILDSMFMITCSKDIFIKYLLALLNSSLSKYWIKNNAATLGDGIYGAKIYIEKLPIPKITQTNQKIVEQITSLVDEILVIKANCHSEPALASEESLGKKSRGSQGDVSGIRPQHDKSDTSTLEFYVDSLVYQLYNLTDEEIKIIGGNNG